MKTLTNGNGHRAARVAFATALVATGLVVTASAQAACFRQHPTIKGTAGADRIVGTNGPDVISTGRGNDVIIGKGGPDLICAGPARTARRAASGWT